MGLVVLMLSVMLSKDLTDLKGYWGRFVKNVQDMYKLEKLGDIECNDECQWSMPLPGSQYDISNDLDLNYISNVYNSFSRMINMIITSTLLGYLILQVASSFYIYQDVKYWSGTAETFLLASAVAMTIRLAATTFIRQRYRAAVMVALRSFIQKMMSLSYVSEVDVANLLVNAVVKATLPNIDMQWVHITAEELLHAASEETLVAKAVVRVAINVAQPEHKVQVARAVISGIIKGMSINAKNNLIREIIFSATELLRSNNMPMLYGMLVAKKVLPTITKTSPKHNKTGLEKIRVEASILTPLLENQIRQTTLMALLRGKITLEEETTEAALQAAKVQTDARGTQSIETSKLLNIMATAAALTYNQTIAEDMLCSAIKAAPVHHKIKIAQASIEVVLLNTADNVRAYAVSKAILAAALIVPTKQRPSLGLKMAESAVAAAIELALKEAKAEIEAKGTASLIISKYSWLVDDIIRAVYGAAFSIESASVSAKAATSKLITGSFPILFNLFPNNLLSRKSLEVHREPKSTQLKILRAILIKERTDEATRKFRQLMASQLTIQSNSSTTGQSIVTAERSDELKFDTISNTSHSARSLVTFVSEDIVSLDTLNIQASSETCSEKTESVKIVSHSASTSSGTFQPKGALAKLR